MFECVAVHTVLDLKFVIQIYIYISQCLMLGKRLAVSNDWCASLFANQPRILIQRP